MGLDFYEKAVELQREYGLPGQTVSNSLQTNAIVLDEKWCQFLHEYRFLVGISLDGPKEFHDYYRVDYSGRGSFDKVMRAIDQCKQRKVEFNILVLLNSRNIEHPDELFDFFVGNEFKYLQFIQCIEFDPKTGEAAEFSVRPEQYSNFMCRIFDRWFEHGPRNLSIRDFDSILSWCLTGRNTICTFDKQCSQYIVVEHNGDCFPCDFFVEPEWRLGNIFEKPIEKLAASDKKRSFARAKGNLCNNCLLCRHLAVCRGGCMKDRLAAICHSERSEESLSTARKNAFSRESYFCESYKRFFDYAMPRFMQIAAEISAGQSATTQDRKG